ncbi:MAG: hypothetical protein ACRC7O_18980 [Fimbriiglobus sp.]
MATISDDKCRAKAKPDEPVFTLLGRDRHAPALVWLWAAIREFEGESPDQVDEALTCVGDMSKHAFDIGRKPVGVGTILMVGLSAMIRLQQKRDPKWSSWAAKQLTAEDAMAVITNYLGKQGEPCPITSTALPG